MRCAVGDEGSVHLAGADKMVSPVGSTIGGALPGGERIEGTPHTARDEGESAMLPLAVGKRR